MRLEKIDVFTRDPLPRSFSVDLGAFRELGGDPVQPTASRDHLRLYYSDYLRVPSAQGVRFLDSEETLLDGDDLLDWTVQAEPRTRTDAYPLLVMSRDLLRRLAQKGLRVSSRRAEELAAELAHARAAVGVLNAELAELRDGQVPYLTYCSEPAEAGRAGWGIEPARARAASRPDVVLAPPEI